MTGAFHFLSPWWLAGLLLCPLLLWAGRAGSSAWYRIMSPAFARVLVTGERSRRNGWLAVAWALGMVALAGPSWQKAQPSGLSLQSNVMVILQQDSAMLAQDIPPSRHQQMQRKLQQLVQALPGSRTGLVVYRSRAFLTVPLTDDPVFFNLFLNAQSPEQLPEGDGSGLQAAVQLANNSFPRNSTVPHSLILVADNLTAQDARWLSEQAGSLPLQVWVPGTAAGGRLPEKFAADTGTTHLNVARFTQLKSAGIPVTLISHDNDDVNAVVRQVQHSVTQQQNSRSDMHWLNSGYWLVIPLLLVLLAGRRQWFLAVLVSVSFSGFSPQASASGWLDAWVSPDMQGQMAFKRGDYAGAAQHYQDPLRRGIALYMAQDYNAALSAFREAPPGPDMLVWQGNTCAQLKQWQQALNRYDEALSLRPGWHLALANRAKIAAIVLQLRKQERDRQAEQDGDQDFDPDAIKHDLEKEQGVEQQLNKPTTVAAPQLSQWYDRLDISPAGLLENLYHAAPEEGQ
ncbi:hypothetical protein DT73_17785 [Mangrovibacter sp. MFB070]|uniref:vWA domain-containing protein n=1 Tax=Mangrovibacter sp. MFB070 TaxID=1224318 RepID=UPI0004D836E6|nr:VWA domain-containing protein [Mangrovibacter sp. MFB070]KEA51559.1 hypothetical protein DT73_17785 [Mangrovibacter sp. MFB070]